MFQGKSVGETVEQVMDIDRNSKMDLDMLEIPSAVPLDLLVSAAAASTIFQPIDVFELQVAAATATSVPPKPAARLPAPKVFPLPALLVFTISYSIVCRRFHRPGQRPCRQMKEHPSNLPARTQPTRLFL
jgi:hypothetical protein